MTLEDLKQQLLSQQDALFSQSKALQALWYESQGDWHRAHEIVQDESDKDSAWVHAYLHRREGDLSNAHYWYQRAERPPATETLSQEWQQITEALLGQL